MTNQTTLLYMNHAMKIHQSVMLEPTYRKPLSGGHCYIGIVLLLWLHWRAPIC